MRASTPIARPLSVLACVALAAGAPSAQEGRGRPGGGEPTRLIVRAFADGQPVTDLKAEELSIRVDGKPQEVKSLELVSTASAGGRVASPRPKEEPAPALPPPFDTNVVDAPASGEAASDAPGEREFLILLDEEGIAPGQEEPVKKAVARLMSEAGEADRFGLVSLRIGGRQIPPSASRGPVSAELAKLVGGGLTNENVVDFTCRTKRIMGGLRNAMTSARAGQTLVVITSGLAANPATIQAIRSRVNAAGEIDDTIPETCQIRSNDLEDFGLTAAVSPANIYFIHFPQGMAAQANLQAGQTGIENLAGVSNAEFIRLTGGVEASLSRVVRETAAYYIATLHEATGPMRRVDARSSRSGVKVIARPAGRPARPAAAASAKGKPPRDLLATTATFAEVPLRAASFISRQGDGLKIVTLFEPVQPGTKLTGAAVGLIDEQGGKVTSTWMAKAGELDRSPAVASLPIKPGKYRVRVAASTADGGGTVDSSVVAELQKAGPLTMGTMLVGVSGSQGFAPRLIFTSAEEMVVGVLDLYGVPQGANVAAVFEVTESETAEPLGSAPGQVGSGDGADARRAFGGFGIATLQPGDYLLRARVSVDGKEVGVATRTFRKVVGS